MRLPPLNSLRAFEAAARHGSFVAAARELGVSPAAVSMQVHKLEDYLGKVLFFRGNNGITMTDAGRLIHPRMARALMEISETTSRILDFDVRSGIVVSTLQSIADRWLVPIIATFFNQHPGVGIELRIDDDPIDLVHERIDLRVTFSAHHYPDLPSMQLFHDEVTPIASQAFFENFGLDLLVQPGDDQFIRVEWGGSYASYPTWADWFRKVGIARKLDARKGIRVGGAGLAAVFAGCGAGVMLGSRTLLAAELAAGNLVAPYDLSIAMPYPYSAVLPRGTAASEPASRTLRGLIRAIQQAAQTSGSMKR